MMGRLNRDQDQFFYAFNFDDAVPADQLVRKIAAVLDLSWVHQELACHYSHLGRPSIDPELMLRMLILGYIFGIRSERALVREVQVNLAYRWFCRLSIEDNVPDHSAFSRARNERFADGDVLRLVFERVVASCIAAGLVGGEGFAVDASLIEADANRRRSVRGQDWTKNIDPETANRATREYLATLDAAAFGSASKTTPKFVSPADPAAQWTGAKRDKAIFAYADNYLIDVTFGIIVDVQASRAIRQAEVEASRRMIDRTQDRFGLKPDYLAADAAYGSAPNLDWLVNDKGIAPHIPVLDKSDRGDGTFSRAHFRFDDKTNRYICPAGKTLKQIGRRYADEALRYFADRRDCQACPRKDRCCPNSTRRKVTRSLYEPARDVARALAQTEKHQQTQHERRKVEMLFAHLKRILGLNRLRLRGPRGAQNEFTLAAIAQNLRRLAKLTFQPIPA
jgi:transposase